MGAALARVFDPSRLEVLDAGASRVGRFGAQLQALPAIPIDRLWELVDQARDQVRAEQAT